MMDDGFYLQRLIEPVNHHDYYSFEEYSRAIFFLFLVPFTPKYSDDVNRLVDAQDYRGHLGYSDKNKPISLLEVMVALAVRVEQSIMLDGRKGDRTPEWFWNMFSSLGFTKLSNDSFDENEAQSIIRKFNNNKYKRDGSGGLFTIKTQEDMTKKTIWQQCMMWLNQYNNT